MKAIQIILIIFIKLFFVSCVNTIDIYASNFNDEKFEDKEDPTIPEGNIVSIDALKNPDRGLHLQCDLMASTLKSPYYEWEFFEDALYTKKRDQYGSQNDSITLVQQYIYLTEWDECDLPDVALNNIKQVFDLVKKNDLKMILRFVYNYAYAGTDPNKWTKESKTWVLKHIEQLTPLLQEYVGQIATLQVGFIGAYGEWHSSPLWHDQDAKNAIVNKLLEAYPEPYCLEMRYPKDKKALTLQNPNNKSRIGFANDYFTAGEHPRAMDNDYVPGTEDYQMVTEEVKEFNYYVSGEIPYAEDSEWGLHELIDPMKTLQILHEHRYSAFDITQNFDLNIKNWKRIKVYPSLLKDMNILYDERYFIDNENKTVCRSLYDFIRDHLGYRLNIEPDMKLEIKDKSLHYDLKITNTGFATVVNPKAVYIVLISENNKVVKEFNTNTNPKEWIPFIDNKNTAERYSITGDLPIDDLANGKYKVGIWMTEENSLKYNSTYNVRFAPCKELNHWRDAEGKYLVNIVGEISI